MIEIRSVNGAVLYTAQNADDIRTALQEAVKARANLARANLADAYLADANLAGAYLADANLAYANLARANLAYAYLARANLAGANLARAYLAGANLADAYLADANLAGAYLAGAYLAGANLAGANLADAYLADAYLADANLAGAAKFSDTTTIETGETWSVYLTKTLPQLVVAGGVAVEEVVCEKHWTCHDWENCPMAAAFKVASEEETPLLLRPRVRQFVRYFDSGLIPLDVARKSCGLPVAAAPPEARDAQE